MTTVLPDPGPAQARCGACAWSGDPEQAKWWCPLCHHRLIYKSAPEPKAKAYQWIMAGMATAVLAPFALLGAGMLIFLAIQIFGGLIGSWQDIEDRQTVCSAAGANSGGGWLEQSEIQADCMERTR
jgi:DNA-directed RNA polymerase subunit RPC12/RpoP